MANKNLCIFIIVATIAAQATWIQATDHLVGDENLGWNNDKKNFQAWADGKEFLQMDTLTFYYTAGTRNVVVAKDKAAFDQCSTEGALWISPACGGNRLTCWTPGPAYVFSGMNQDCQNGMKFFFDVKPSPAVLNKIGVNLTQHTTTQHRGSVRVYDPTPIDRSLA
ncbi:hypothetical protein QVD17_42265 [Tagetes erecta]|uniref:Phytocyanin domain-containing protein n=1 Tax=Tagetes erecta TaxID=13708 RepID=A0AAD8NFJ4_TARER|nr:hypothetical protein QVD17_42265 [Tagetes erecta]